MACAFARELVSRVFCDKRMTSDRFYDPYISFVFPSGLYLCVMRPNINTIETFESSRALTFSVISLEIVLHAYLFIGQGLHVYPKHFFFGVNTILLFAGLTCHLRSRLSCLLFRQNAKYRQDVPKSNSTSLRGHLFGVSIHAKMRNPQEKATKLQNDVVEVLTFMPGGLLSGLFSSSAGGASSMSTGLIIYQIATQTTKKYCTAMCSSPAQHEEPPPSQRPPIARSRALIPSSTWK